MMNSLRILTAITFGFMLTGCGGGSSNSSGSAPTNLTTGTTAKITAQCADKDNKVSVTTTGCTFTGGNNTQTALCSGNTLYMLSGTGWTAAEVSKQGSSFSAGGLILNGKTLSCTTK